MKRYLVYVLAALLVLALLPAVALADGGLSDANEIAEALKGEYDEGTRTITLEKDVTIDVTGVTPNSAKFILPNGVTVDGGNYTITVTGNAAASLFLVSGDSSSATIKDLTIIGSKGIKHGMQA